MIFITKELVWEKCCHTLTRKEHKDEFENAVKEAYNSNKIADTGPFVLIRHPIYSSVYVISAGLGLLFYSTYWFIVLLIFVPFWYIESKEEERQMIEYHGEKYTNYKIKTKMFIPCIF